MHVIADTVKSKDHKDVPHTHKGMTVLFSVLQDTAAGFDLHMKAPE